MARTSNEPTVPTEIDPTTGEPIETETDVDEDDDADEKTKRERIDLENVNPDTKVMLAIPVPAGLKLAIMKAAETDDESLNNFARNILAARMEYTVPASFTERKRRAKTYATEEERKEAQKANQLDQRKQMAAFLKMMEDGVIPENLLESYKANVTVKTRNRKS